VHFLGLERQSQANEKLKETMCKTHVVATPNFTKTFIVKCDASWHGIGEFYFKKEGPLPLRATNLKERTYSNAFLRRKCWPYYMQLSNEALR
jgi:hypothetical protein